MIQKVGGALVDMKEIQIHPTVQQSDAFLIGEAVRGEGAILAFARSRTPWSKTK